MTTVVMWFKVSERDVIEQTFLQRAGLRRKHNCLNARLLADKADPNRFLVIWDFPSREQARAYLTESLFLHGGVNLADMDERVIGYYEDVSTWPDQVRQAS